MGKIIVLFLVAGGVIAGLMASWTELNLEFWLSLIKGESVDVPYIIALLLSVLTNVFGLMFNLISELLKLIL